MSNLIEALQIFLKYGDPIRPTHCSHDELLVCTSPTLVSDEDKSRLKELGFFPCDSDDCFKSYRFGSC